MKEIKVNLRPLLKQLEVSLKKGETSEFIPSAYRSRYFGRGLEFQGFRQYLPGMDDAKDIDWKSSLRSRDLLVKILREERNLSAFIVMDVSDSMLYASNPKLKCEFAAELAGTLAFGMLNVGDSAGLAMFTDKIVKLIPSGTGLGHFYFITRMLTNAKLYGGEYNLKRMLEFCLGTLPSGTIIFILSDFLGLEPGWTRLYSMCALKFDVTSFVIRDPRDMSFPEENLQFVVGDPYSQQELLIDTGTIREEYENAAMSQLVDLTETFIHTNSDYIILMTDQEFVQPVRSFFQRRRSRLK